jgi:hypothetical protein
VEGAVLKVCLSQVQQGTSLNWRSHLDGVHKIISLRGGFRAVIGSRRLEPLLLALWLYVVSVFLWLEVVHHYGFKWPLTDLHQYSLAVIANTTCPASDLAMTESHLGALDLLLQHYGAAVTPLHMCPLPLFAEIVRISHLRAQAMERNGAPLVDISQDAYSILERIHDFSPEQWAMTKISAPEIWALVGRAYRAAVALYCILALQSVPVLPVTSSLRACCTTHGELLQILLEETLVSSQIKRSMLWPLVVLGVEAVHQTPARRAFITRQLPLLSHDVGTQVPLTAKRVLERFWRSGETSWDSCFDKPYAFTMQIAVDTSRLLPP